MRKLFIFIGMNVFGWLGWRLGVQMNPTVGYLLGAAGSLLGVYVGWRIHRDYLE